ncbi:hypothetical protein V494_02421 [Pseudogymnoascus sp. VKM F-4513 (FW-928)]|nr:hypothetical protein V494_02421 [Pseudogymnoascus sp. VKM F-4513 (FW-928)]
MVDLQQDVQYKTSDNAMLGRLGGRQPSTTTSPDVIKPAMTMLSSLVRSLPQFGRKWKPLEFSNPNFVRIPEYHKIEEETFPDYVASRYYLTRIGEVIKDRYQVVGKLGFGSTSTAWLARDMNYRRYVMLKISIQASSMGKQMDDELKMYRRMEQSPKGHLGRDSVRTLLDTFYVDGPEDKHQCLVHPPLFENIKAANIMLGINDDSVFTELEERELEKPVPRKEVDSNGRTIYMSQDLGIPSGIGVPVLCDFGSAVLGDQHHSKDIQPNIYRSPEVWDIYEGGSLFTGQDPEFQKYRSRAHLAEMINLLGPPPTSLLAQAALRDKFFSADGK